MAYTLLFVLIDIFVVLFLAIFVIHVSFVCSKGDQPAELETHVSYHISVNSIGKTISSRLLELELNENTDHWLYQALSVLIGISNIYYYYGDTKIP